MTIYRTFVIGLIVFSLQSIAVNADDVEETLKGIVVDSATVSASPQGGTAELKFRVANEGRNTLTLMSIASQLSDDITFVMNDPYEGPKRLRSVSVPRDESLDMTSSHFKAVVRNVKRSLEPGDNAKFEFRFSTTSITVNAHVN